jgi:hypothetical protein
MRLKKDETMTIIGTDFQAPALVVKSRSRSVEDCRNEHRGYSPRLNQALASLPRNVQLRYKQL